MDELDSTPQGLRAQLESARQQFDRAIREAEARRDVERASERLAILREFQPLLESQAERLAGLDAAAAAAARSVAEGVAREAKELAALLAPERPVLLAGTLRAPHALDPASPDTLAPEAGLLVPDEQVAETGPPAPAAPPPELLALARETFREAKALDMLAFALHGGAGRSPAEDLDELEARLRVAVFRARLLQDEHPLLNDESTDAGRVNHEAFGVMSRIAREVLAPRGRFVRGLQRGFVADWRHELARSEEKLAALHRERAVALQLAEAARRESAIRAERERVFRQTLDDLKDHCAATQRDRFWEWDFLDLVRDAVDNERASDEDVLRLVAPHASLVAQGGEFRNLRRHLRRFLDDSAPRAGTMVLPVAEGMGEPRSTATHPCAHLRGALSGRRAALVGASSREARRRRVQDFFGLDELDWIENERTERADGLATAQRIESGRYDLVFLLADFCSHALQDHVKDACKRSGVPFCLVLHGYGTAAIGRALEQSGQHAAGVLAASAPTPSPEGRRP